VGLVTGLWLAKDLGIRRLLIPGDSQLVAKQVQKEYDCNNDKMAEYLVEVRRLEKFFDGFEIRYVPRLDNRDADHLAWIASSRAPTPPDVILERLAKLSVKATEPSKDISFMVIDGSDQQSGCDWMNQIRSYLENQPLADDDAEIERIACKFRMYHLIDGVLYMQGANGMMMRCISKGEDIQLLRDIQSGVCGAHLSWRFIVEKTFKHEFYWPTTKDDAMEIVAKCRDCQFFQK
jgi:hypothetical protein